MTACLLTEGGSIEFDKWSQRCDPTRREHQATAADHAALFARRSRTPTIKLLVLLKDGEELLGLRTHICPGSTKRREQEYSMLVVTPTWVFHWETVHEPGAEGKWDYAQGTGADDGREGQAGLGPTGRGAMGTLPSPPALTT